MPGPVSDSYDPEFGTAANAEAIRSALKKMHTELGLIIGSEPIPILDVVNRETAGSMMQAALTEKEWRILRFACERASESI